MENLNLLKLRAKHANNDRQHDRMVKDKLRSLHRALLYSYQTAWIKKDGVEDADYVRALINPDKVKFDYDEKIVSVEYEHGFGPGDTFEWKNTGTHWIILKQEMTEVAYFRGNVRRCQELLITDPETGDKVSIWAAVRGPVETKLNTIQKAGLVANVPNMTLQLYIPKTEQNMRLFERYVTFEFGGRFWQIVAPDTISTPGIIEIPAVEDYECHHSDLLVEVVDPNPPVEEYEDTIEGETFVKPLEQSIYTVTSYNPNINWIVTLASDNKDVEDTVEWEIREDGSIAVTWISMVSGSYVLKYGDLEKTIIVQSLF